MMIRTTKDNNALRNTTNKKVTLEAYLDPCQTSMMVQSCEKMELLVVFEKVPSRSGIPLFRTCSISLSLLSQTSSLVTQPFQ